MAEAATNLWLVLYHARQWQMGGDKCVLLLLHKGVLMQS